MSLAHLTAVQGEGIVANRMHSEVEKIKVSKEGAEQVGELGEATSSSSMKSPVTPAAVSEQNGTLATRWKSYTAKQQESSHGNLGDGDSKGPKHVPAGSSDNVPQCTMKSNLSALKDQNAGFLARKLCLKIRKIRRTLKISQRAKPDRCKLESSSQPDNREGETYPLAQHNNIHISTEDRCQNGREGTTCDVERHASLTSHVEKDASLKGSKCTEDSHKIAADGEQQEVTGSEDVIYSDDDCQGRQFEEPVDHEGYENYKVDMEQIHYNDLNALNLSDHQRLSEAKDSKCASMEIFPAKDNGRQLRGSLSHDAGAFLESSKLDMKEQTVLETLLSDEPTGYSSAGASEQSLRRKVGRFDHREFTQRLDHTESGEIEDSDSSDAESDGANTEGSQSDEYDKDSGSSEGHDCEDEECNCDFISPSSVGGTPCTPRRVAGFNEQVPSVLCDAEGNLWHIGKRAEQAKGTSGQKRVSSSRTIQKERICSAKELHHVEVNELDTSASGLSMTPFADQIDLNWKWPCDADYSIESIGEVSNRFIAKERAIFVGCIPDGTEKVEGLLQNLMEKFLERFDFAPAFLSQIQLVKVLKDFAFLELATEKVAHIVLAANQLDVFEWGVNGLHFNIEGCKGTHTSVRPLIEYMPLKPARVIFIGNIPKSRWQKEYLEVFFARILRGSDGPSDVKFVLSVYLLPESCDAYLELASELMADAIIFKCNKNPQLLKEMGEDVFICRDRSSVPLMSKHKSLVSPERSLFVGVSAPGQEFKIDRITKVFEEILPMIARETNQPGYLEYISVQPGKDYAFFQFNSESIVDAVMEEYIENTHFFACSNTPALSYIILRPPDYVRPGTRYQTDSSRQPGLKLWKSYENNRAAEKIIDTWQVNAKRRKSKHPLVSRRFGDEPPKRTDCVISIGASPLPRAKWNVLPSRGACATDPDCMLVIEDLPKGLRYKLLRGALNEMFERALCQTGLLEVGMLLLRNLDRDNNLDVVASLPSAKFVNALLSLRQTFKIAGTEIRLVPKGGQRKITWKGNPAEPIGGQGEVSSDEEIYHGEEHSGHHPVDVRNAVKRKWCRSQSVAHRSQIVAHPGVGRKPATMQVGLELDSAAFCEESISHFTKNIFRGDISRPLKAVKSSWSMPMRHQETSEHISKAVVDTHWEDGRSKARMHRSCTITGPLKLGRKLQVKSVEEAKSTCDDPPKEILHIISEGGRRKIQTVGPLKTISGLEKTNKLRMASKKRKLSHMRQDLILLQMKRLKKFGLS